MKTVIWLGTAALLVSGMSLAAQQAGVSAQQTASAGSQASEGVGVNASAQAHPGGASATGAANGSATAGHAGGAIASSAHGRYSAEDMRSVSGELQNKLDSRTARVGDPVVLKTTQKMKTADGTVLPRGTRLIGHVTEVQAHNSSHARSELGIDFDRAEMKHGQSIPIHSTIRSIEPRANAFADDSMAADDSLASPVGGGVAGGGMRGGGGGRLLGGAPAGGALNAVGGATAQTGARLDDVADGTVHTTGGIAGHAAGDLGDMGTAVRGTGDAGGGLVAHATGVPGVMLRSGMSESDSGVLSMAKKNVHLDSGTQMDLGIVTAARQ